MMVVDSFKVKNGKLLLLLYSIKTRLECSAISVAAVAATTPPPSHRATSDQRRRRRRWLMMLYWQRANSVDREEKAQENRLYLRPDLVVVLFPLHTLSSPCNSSTAGLYTISSTSQEMELAIRDQWRSGKVNIYIPSEIHGGRQPQIGTTTAI